MTDKIYSLLFIIFLFSIWFIGCQTTEEMAVSEKEREDIDSVPSLQKLIEHSDLFSSIVTGFMLFDPEADSTIYSLNGHKYFTPASNTKLFTFYAGLKALPDSLRALEYVALEDSLIFWGTGDPSFLHREYGTGTVYHFLKNSSQDLFYSDLHYHDEPFGAGWSWDDYNSYYSAEKSPFPIYGNMVQFTIENIEINRIKRDNQGFMIDPDLFQQKIEKKSGEDDPILVRHRTGNEFEYYPTSDTTTYKILKPFHYTPLLLTSMISDTLGRYNLLRLKNHLKQRSFTVLLRIRLINVCFNTVIILLQSSYCL